MHSLNKQVGTADFLSVVSIVAFDHYNLCRTETQGNSTTPFPLHLPTSNKTNGIRKPSQIFLTYTQKQIQLHLSSIATVFSLSRDREWCPASLLPSPLTHTHTLLLVQTYYLLLSFYPFMKQHATGHLHSDLGNHHVRLSVITMVC